MKRKTEALAAFVLFLAVASAYFFRIFTGDVPVFGDGLSWIYPMRLYQKAAGLMPPLWMPHLFSGMPFIGLMQTAALYPPNIALYSLLPAPVAFDASFLIHYALAGLFTYLYLREAGLGKTPAFFGATVFAFSGFMAETKQHVAILNASAWLPLVVYFAERLRKSLSTRDAASLALALAMQLLAGNFQICLYTYIVLTAFFAFYLPEVESGKRLRFGLLGAAGVSVGLLIAFPQVAATWQAGGLSLRPVVREALGHIFTGEFYVYLSTLPSLVFPHLYSRADFGTLLPVPGDRMTAFAGVLPLSVALAAVFTGFRSSRNVRLWTVVGLLGLALSSADGTPLGRVLFRLPVYGMFHAHGRNLLEFSFAASVLFAVGMEGALSGGRGIGVAFKALVAVSALGIMGLAVTYASGGAEARKALTLSNPAVFVPLVFIALYALGLFGLKRKRVFVYMIFAVVIAEAWVFGAHHEAGWTRTSELSGKCDEKGYGLIKGLSGKEPFRAAMVNTEKQNLFNAPCGVEMFNAQDQLIPADYAVLTGIEPFGFSRYWDTLLANNSILSMMNVGYLAVAEPYEGIMNGVAISGATVSPETVMAWEGPFLLPAPGDRSKNRILLAGQVTRGMYLASARARALGGGKASLRMEVYNEGQASLRDGGLPFNLYPGMVDGRGRPCYRLYNSEKPEFIGLSFSAPRHDEVELREVALRRLPGYGPPPIATNGPVYEKIGEAGGYGMYLNRNALPRAYSVTSLAGAEDIHDVKAMFDLQLVNPARTAVLFKGDLDEIGDADFARAEVSIKEYRPEKVVLRSASRGKSFIVLADQFYPGWRAYIDGDETRIYRANGVLRGVIVPRGEHEVVFNYAPPWLIASMAGGAMLALVLLVYATASGKRG